MRGIAVIPVRIDGKVVLAECAYIPGRGVVVIFAHTNATEELLEPRGVSSGGHMD